MHITDAETQRTFRSCVETVLKMVLSTDVVVIINCRPTFSLPVLTGWKMTERDILQIIYSHLQFVYYLSEQMPLHMTL